MNLAWLLKNSAAKNPQGLAMVAEEGRFSFAELFSRASKLAGALAGLGLAPGDRVGILFFNGARFVESYFACLIAGCMATPINYRLTAPEMAYMLNDSGARVLLHGQEFADIVARAAGDAPGVASFVSPGAVSPSPALDYEDFLANAEPLAINDSLGEDAHAQLMYTSGTTGRPKGAIITHKNVTWNLFNTLQGREDKQGQVSVIVGPLYHTAALNNHLTIQLALGGTSLLIKKFEPERLLADIERERATLISGSPAMFNLLMNHPAAKRHDRSSVTKCTAGADKLPMETKRRLLDFFPNISGVYDVYGCTEASPCITILNKDDSMRKDGSVGRALPFLDAKVVDEEGRDLPPGQVGEIVCRGPNVMAGYWGRPEETAATIVDGWLHTGDLAVVDEEGFFFIVDRKKDMIVSGGENIYPREVEEVLFTHPAVADAAVVGMPDELWGESVCACIELHPGQSVAEEEIIEFCKERLASYKKPRRVRFVPAIPRNPSGKALKTKLREKS